MSLDIYKNVRVTDVITKKYDDWLTHDHVNSQFRSYRKFHPSDMGYCIRKAVKMRLGHEGKFYTIPKMQRTFENGHSTHARLQSHFGDMGFLYGRWICSNCEFVIGNDSKIGVLKPSECPNCNNAKKTSAVVDDVGNIVAGPKSIFEYKELSVDDEEMELHGHTDGVLALNGNLFVIDFKTCSKSVYDELNRRNEPLEAHVFQVNIYMYILGVPAAFLFYENKNSMEIKEFLLVQDNEIIEEVKKRAALGIKCYREGTVPDIPESMIPEILPYGYRDLKFSCQGYPAPQGSVKFPPCPFMHNCFPEQYEEMGGDERMNKLYIKIDKRLDYDD